MHDAAPPLEDVNPLPFIVMVVGLAVAGYTWWRESSGRTALGRRVEGPPADTGVALAVAIVLWGGLQVLLGELVLPTTESPPYRVLAVSLVHLAVALVVLRPALSGPRPSIRFRWSIPIGVIGGVATYGGVALVSLVLMKAYEAVQVDVPTQDVVEVLEKAPPDGKALLTICAIFLAPFAEEVFYRGVLLPVLARGMRGSLALIVQALVFGFSHFAANPIAWPLALPIALVGWGAGWLYLRTGSLWAAVFLHATFNALQIGLLFVATS